MLFIMGYYLAILCVFLLLLLWFCVYCGLLVDACVKTEILPDKSMTIAYRFSRGSCLKIRQLYFEAKCVMPNLPRIGIFYGERKARRLCAHPAIEIYGPSDVQFVVPLTKQTDFYVPEAESPYSTSEENSF